MVLHGTWVPSASSGTFFIWGEMKNGALPAAQEDDAAAPPHPFTAPPPLVFLALQSRDDVVSGPIPESRKVFHLPTVSSTPLPSPIFSAYCETPPEGDPHVAAWSVRGVELDPATALPLLALRIAEDFDGRPGLLIADDLRYWAQPALLALEILARQRYVPGVVRQGEGEAATPRWRPILGDTDIANRVATLAENIPFASRAFETPPRPVHDILASFFQASVDASIRIWCEFTELRRHLGLAQPPGAVWRWISALAGGGDGNDLGALTRDVVEWTSAIRTDVDRSAARTCFRLDPPGNATHHNPRDPSAWTLSYYLQSAEDPAVQIPARQVWRERARVLEASGRRMYNPQDKLLGDLGRAARLFSPIERSLRRRRPEMASLRMDLAYKFLSEGAPLLRESGFGILVPASLDASRGARLGIRGKLSADPAPLNMDMPVRFEWEIALGETSLNRADLDELSAMPVPLVQAGGEWVCLSKEEISAAIRLLAARKSAEITLRDALRMGVGKGAVVAGLPVTGAVATGWLDDVLSKLSNPERMAELSQPARFLGVMRPYQIRGLSWLDFLTRYGLGACLADDMGLGKTIQLIALVLQQRAIEPKAAPVLLVCPTSVLGYWEREIRRFAPSLRVLVHHGSSRQKDEAFREAAVEAEIVLSTYSLLARDLTELVSITWRGVVLDEAQNIKNPSTKQSRAARAIKGGYRVALTGTPVENHPGELWSIMEFLNQGYLGRAEEFRRRFYVPIRFNRDRRAIEQLRRLVQPFMLRRNKSDKQIIQDLPEKYEMKVYCGLTREQASLYEAIVRDSMKKIAGTSGIDRKGAILAALVRLKQVCNHPAHLMNDGSALSDRSGKLTRLEEMLEEALDEGDRMLIFTQFKVMGDLLTRHLQSRFGREVLFLHGGIEASHRTRMVERFETEEAGPHIFVLSVKAGGTGLNLSRANRVFHFDRWWNPAVENQATDRAFRIGQTRDVMVHKFVCAGTVEEKIDAMIESKKEMAEGLVAAGEDWLTEFSTEDLATMFTLQKDAVIEL
ncbi:MAG: DEAD/DEAH box helicase [Acidobacteria bacterium]|nr:DEAD/DEAH box helicase [Acidobacteriota bacterium]